MIANKILNIQLNEKSYNIYIFKKKISSLRLKINQKEEILFSIPTNYPYYKAMEFLEKNKLWIYKSLSQMEDRPKQDNVHFKSDNQIMLLGENKKIKILFSKKECIKIDENYAYIFAKQNSEQYIKNKFPVLAKKFLYNYILEKYLRFYNEIFKEKNVKLPTLKIRAMKSMWGNCNYVQNAITLNLYLIKTPINCIEYVILHELTHTIFHNHQKEFKDFLTQYMPLWRKYKKELNNYTLSF